MTDETAYTINDTPNVVERIERDLDHVIETVRNNDPHLRSLILTGGFARGEGTISDGEPQNDYDFAAIRSLGQPDTSYDEMANRLERALGLHIDLAPINAWRLRWVNPTIFWYETARRGRILWGENLLDSIPVQDPTDIDPTEGLRLLTNRAAGLLLATRKPNPHTYRIQAAKGLLAALDANLLALGQFPPSQTERWYAWRTLQTEGGTPPPLEPYQESLEWAIRFKLAPDDQPLQNPQSVWTIAAEAILDSIPPALDHANLPSLEAYKRQDGILDHIHYALKAPKVEEATRFTTNPTGTVRVATLRLLKDSRSGKINDNEAYRHLRGIATVHNEPLQTLDALREATLQ